MCIFQYFKFSSKSITITEFKTEFGFVTNAFKKHKLDNEKLLLMFAVFDQKKKVFTLKPEFKHLGSNLTPWSVISVLS